MFEIEKGCIYLPQPFTSGACASALSNRRLRPALFQPAETLEALGQDIVFIDGDFDHFVRFGVTLCRFRPVDGQSQEQELRIPGYSQLYPACFYNLPFSAQQTKDMNASPLTVTQKDDSKMIE